MLKYRIPQIVTLTRYVDPKMFQLCFSRKRENPCKLLIYKGLSSSFRTQTRGRTGMEVNPLVFETSASTDSAIWACLTSQMRCKDTAFF